MTDFLTSLEHELVQAAHRQSAGRGGRRRGPGRGLVAGAALALAVPAAAAAAVAVWQPSLGDDRRGHPSAATSRPSARAQESMAVLRRPQTAEDREPSVQRALSLLSPSTVSGVQTASIRTLGRAADGQAIVLIPVERLTVPLLKGETDAVRSQQLLVFYPDATDGGGITTTSAADVASGRAALGSGLGRVSFGLVPDGVAQVRVGYADGSQQTVAVSSNFWQATAPGGLTGIDAQATELQPLDAAGKPTGATLHR